MISECAFCGVSLNAWRGFWGPDWQRRTWRKGSLWESKCVRLWVWDSVILTMNLHPAGTPYTPTPAPLLSPTTCRRVVTWPAVGFIPPLAFPFPFTIRSFNNPFSSSDLQVLHYQTPWGLACCLWLPGVLYVWPVVSASGFLTKCPCNRSPCDTGNTVAQLWGRRLEPLIIWNQSLKDKRQGADLHLHLIRLLHTCDRINHWSFRASRNQEVDFYRIIA